MAITDNKPKSLLEAIRQPVAQPLAATGETQKIASMLRARSGKDTQAPQYAQSNLGEQSAVSQANSEIQNQVLPQSAIQQAGMQQQSDAQLQQASQQKEDLARGTQFDKLKNTMRTEQILSDLERGKGEIDVKKRGAQMLQLASNLRLQTDKYVGQLQNEGKKSRLDDGLNFDRELTRTIFDGNQDLVEKQLLNKGILATSDQEFMKKIADMDISMAQSLFNTESKANAEAGKWAMGGNVASVGVSTYGKIQDAQDREKAQIRQDKLDAKAGI